jgi:hypothetical protein
MIDHTATLTTLLDQLAAAIAEARTAGTIPYAEALALFQRLDALHEQMELLLVETQDYPHEDDE